MAVEAQAHDGSRKKLVANVGAFEMLFQGLKLVFFSWRLTLVQVLPASGISTFASSGTAHARSGDAVAIASYLGAGDSFDRALASFAEAYPDQNERDYGALQDAVATGRVTAETGL